jgi:hypothetical protein
MRPGILSLILLASCLTVAADHAEAAKGKIVRRTLKKAGRLVTNNPLIEAAQRTRMEYGAKLVHLAEDLVFHLDQLSVKVRGRPLAQPKRPGRPEGWLRWRLSPSGLRELWTRMVMGVAEAVANLGPRTPPRRNVSR